MALEIIFWVACFIIVYNYAGYALLVMIFNYILPRPKKAIDSGSLPSVSFIVAAYNEEDVIGQKIENSLEQNYPPELIEYIFITDGSTDNTSAIIQKNGKIKLLHTAERKGKSAAINRAVANATKDILIFSDANTFLNKDATHNIAVLYTDKRVGGVAGEKKVVKKEGDSTVSGGEEGAYWKYESKLKQIDSRFYSVVGAAGELFSLRRELYEPLPSNVILDDFVISLRVASKGYRILYEPRAFAMELPSFSIKDEQKRKIRIAAGGFQSMKMLIPLLYFWRHPRLSFLYVSHRVLRWTLSPLCLVLAFVSNMLILYGPHSILYTWLFVGQCIFYFIAIIGSQVKSPKGLLKLAKLAYYFVFMNVSVMLGFSRYLKGNQSAAWEKSRRAQGHENL